MDEESESILDKKRKRLLEHKSFLQKLLTTPAKLKKILADADNSELNILLELLHWFSRGEIGINKSLHKRLQTSSAASVFKKNIVREDLFEKLLKNKRSKKIAILVNLCSLIPLFIKELKQEK